jgi:hypothetical protein
VTRFVGLHVLSWKGHDEAKEGYLTIGLEAMTDNNLRIWHTTFGFAGLLNDINIVTGLQCTNLCLMGLTINFPFHL